MVSCSSSAVNVSANVMEFWASSTGRSKKPLKLPKDVGVTSSFDQNAFNFYKAPSTDFLFAFSAKPSQSSRVRCQPAQKDSDIDEYHAVLINPYPIGNYSSLLVPYFWNSLPQQVLRIITNP